MRCACTDCLAVSLREDFKGQFVPRFPKEGFTMTAAEVKKLDLLDWAEETRGE